MFKDVLNQMDFLSALWTTGLLMFLAIFVTVVLYALTRSRQQADRWARIPLLVEEPEARGTHTRTSNHE